MHADDDTTPAHDFVEDPLVMQAVRGDVQALGQLLQRHSADVAEYIDRHLPPDVRGHVDTQDILQDVCFNVFRRIGTFRSSGPDGFLRWLLTIARHRIIDLVRGIRSDKRGGGRQVSNEVAPTDDASVIVLLTDMKVYARTPSESALSHEAVSVLHQCLNGLAAEHREALQRRYIDGLSAADVAQRMAKSEGAVHMLCQRALQALRAEVARRWGVVSSG